MKKVGKCCLCLQETKLIKAHIYPDFFYKNEVGFLNEKNHLIKMTPKEYLKTKTHKYLPSGDYDNEILCRNCDGTIIGKYENYMRMVVYGDKGKLGLKYRNYPTSYPGYSITEIAPIDFAMIKLFGCSLLFKSAVSQREYCENINLTDEQIEKLRQMILFENPGSVKDFPVITYMYRSRLKPNDHAISPFIMKNDRNKTDMARFFICGTNINVLLLNGKELPTEYEDVIAKPHSPLRIVNHPNRQMMDYLYDLMIQ